MSAYIRQLLDEENNPVYPVSSASSTYLSDGKYSVQNALDNLQDGNMTINFKSDGQIEKTLSSGDKVTTVFNNDNTITETTVNSDGGTLQTKTIKFNEDGSIEIEVV